MTTDRRVVRKGSILLTLASVLCMTALLSGAAGPISPVADAAMRRDVAAIKTLLKQGADVNAAQGDGMTALHWAAEHGDSAMAGVLLYAGANVKAVTRINSYTPLHLAGKSGSSPTVKALLAAGSAANTTTTTGATALHFAAAAGSAEAVTALLARGANANAKEGEWGQTPLIFAAEYDRGDAVKALIKGGADPNIATRAVSIAEQGARDAAATRRRNEVVAAFRGIAPGADGGGRGGRGGGGGQGGGQGGPPGAPGAAAAPAMPATPAPVAAAPIAAATVATAPTPAQIQAAPAPLAEGVAPQPAARPAAPPAPPIQLTPSQMQAAIAAGRLAYESLLNVDPNAAPVEDADTTDGAVAGFGGSVGGMGGLTALHHAARQGSVAAAKALIEGGADVNQRSGPDRSTPLLVATISGQYDVALLLIANKADPKLASTAGATPLFTTINSQWAMRSRFPQPQAVAQQKSNYLEVMEALLKGGAEPNVRIRQHLWYFAYNNCGNGNCGLEQLEGATPFWRATYSVDVDAMRMLVKYGADPKIPTQRAAGGAGGRGGGGGGRGGRGGGRGGAAGAPGAPGAPGAVGGAIAGRGAAQPDSAALQNTVQSLRGAGARGGGRGQVVAQANQQGADSAAAQGRGGRGFAGGGFPGGGGGGAPLTPDDTVGRAPNGIGVLPIHAAAGVGYGEGYAGNSHRHAPDGWLPAMKYLVEELGADVNARDAEGYAPLHHAAARGDNEMILYLVSKGANVKAVAGNGRTTVDMANGPVSRITPIPATIALLEKLGAKNNHRCASC